MIGNFFKNLARFLGNFQESGFNALFLTLFIAGITWLLIGPIRRVKLKPYFKWLVLLALVVFIILWYLFYKSVSYEPLTKFQ